MRIVESISHGPEVPNAKSESLGCKRQSYHRKVSINMSKKYDMDFEMMMILPIGFLMMFIQPMMMYYGTRFHFFTVKMVLWG